MISLKKRHTLTPHLQIIIGKACNIGDMFLAREGARGKQKKLLSWNKDKMSCNLEKL